MAPTDMASPEALYALLDLAREGDATARKRLGYLYQGGLGVGPLADGLKEKVAEWAANNRASVRALDTLSQSEALSGTMRGAHGQPEGLHWQLLNDGTLLFHDRPRMVFGACHDKVPVEDRHVVDVVAQVHTTLRRAYFAPPFDSSRGCVVAGYSYDGRAQTL